ncbi:MAG: hypothetical protein HC774_06645 [Sphingomonadales bacterium]|nr:hypothetical protein [Sphingomonadales bacterium]
MGFVDDRDAYQIRYADATFPDDTVRVVSQSETSIVMNSAEARATAERWLTESRVSRDTLQLDLPRSFSRLGAGDVVKFGNLTYRLDRADRRESLRFDAVRIESQLYLPGDPVEQQQLGRPFTPPLPVFAAFLDIPNLAESDVPHAPYVAAFSQPWQGDVGVWRSVDNESFELDTTVSIPSLVGNTLTDLPRAPTGVWDDGDPLIVEVSGSSSLQSVSDIALFAGANTVAIGSGLDDQWEVLQFRDAELIAPGIFSLRRRLRGQLGSDGVMPAVWPAGSQIIGLNSALRQSGIADAQRGLEMNFRIGSLLRGPEDTSATAITATFAGNGLRPYPVAHLRAERLPGGVVRINWIRRTRRGGDGWQSIEVPLAEDSEVYAVEISNGSAVQRNVTAASTTYDYTLAMQVADGISAPFTIRVAQLSQAFGAGPFREIAMPV